MNEVNSTPDVLTLDEAAAYLRVSTDAMKQLLTSRSISARQIDGEWRVAKATLTKWLEGPTAKENLAALAGAWKDDETLPELLRDIYKRRGRPMIEPKPKKRRVSHAST